MKILFLRLIIILHPVFSLVEKKKKKECENKTEDRLNLLFLILNVVDFYSIIHRYLYSKLTNNEEERIVNGITRRVNKIHIPCNCKMEQNLIKIHEKNFLI